MAYAAVPAASSKLKHERDQLIINENGDTWWLILSPLLCGGCGCGPCQPLVAGEGKICCAEWHQWTEEDVCCGGSGCCFDFEKVCCCVYHSSCPPGGGSEDGVPCCAVCNYRCGADKDEAVQDNIRTQSMAKAFLLFYLGCFGIGVVPDCFPLVMASRKWCCCRAEVYTAGPFSNNKPWCYAYTKLCCVVVRKLFPACGGKEDGLPGCACCGRTLCCPPQERPRASGGAP